MIHQSSTQFPARLKQTLCIVLLHQRQHEAAPHMPHAQDFEAREFNVLDLAAFGVLGTRDTSTATIPLRDHQFPHQPKSEA